MKILDFLNHINQNQRGKLVNFIQRYDFHNTKLELVSGQLAATIQDDAGTLSLAICCQHIPSNSDTTWDFIIVTDTMATKDADEVFTCIRMDAELVRLMLPPKRAEFNFESNEHAEKAAALSVRLEMLQEKYNDTKGAYDLASEDLKETHKRMMELSAWKIEHSGNYRHAGRPRRFDKFEQGHSIYLMHDKENVSFRKIASLMNMSYSSARRLYQEYIDFHEKYGKKTDISQRDE